MTQVVETRAEGMDAVGGDGESLSALSSTEVDDLNKNAAPPAPPAPKKKATGKKAATKKTASEN